MFAAKNMLLTPKAASTAVAYDATGAGDASGSANPSFVHTATAGAYVLAFIGEGNYFGAQSPSSAPTYGGTPMTLLGSNSYGSNAYIWCYGLANVSGGAETVAFAMSGSGPFLMNTVSYTNVNTVSLPTAASGTGNGTFSQSVTLTAGQMAVNGLGAQSSAATGLSGGTSRYNPDSAYASGYGTLNISDSTASTTFTGTVSYFYGANWATLPVILSPH